MSGLLELRGTLRAELLDFIRDASPAPGRFDALALRVARYQAEAITAYGRLVAARGGLGDSWRTAPLVPTELFREIDLTGPAPAGSADTVFRTSGTTGGSQRGERRAPDLALYHAGMRAPFVAHVLDSDTTRRPWISLVPPRAEAPESSLSHMISVLADELADPASSAWCMTPEGLDLEAAAAALSRASGPVVVLTTSFALINLLDGQPDLSTTLAPGSRLMLTGGFKGKTRDVSEPELVRETQARLGLGRDAIVSEYGMTELTSQSYGTPLTAPPWLRQRVVDPATGSDLPPGERGLVAFFDLLNLDNVSAILTSDLGELDPQGRLVLHGRAPGAIARGCSLTAEELGLLSRPDPR